MKTNVSCVLCAQSNKSSNAFGMQLSMLSQLFTKPMSATLVRSNSRDNAGPSSPGLDFGGDSFGAAGKSFSALFASS
jgi:hypothetical protein